MIRKNGTDFFENNPFSNKNATLNIALNTIVCVLDTFQDF